MNSPALFHQLEAKMAGPLPGAAAQFKMAPRHRQNLAADAVSGLFKPSAVMLLLCSDYNGDLFIPLIERPAYKGAHSAQISLPGGKADPSDPDLESTARRECFEEIGINDVKVLGALTTLHIAVSNYRVHPFVGLCETVEPVFLPNEREVTQILRMPLNDLSGEHLIEQGRIEVPEKYIIEAPWFNVNGHRVWGATAMILSEFREILKSIV